MGTVVPKNHDDQLVNRSHIRLRIRNRNDVTSNYQTGVKWMLATLVQCQNNRYKVGTHALFCFRLIISQTIKLTQWVTHTIK